MSKNPHFKFYSSDFLTGVSDLTMEERGQYITLLCYQHQKGRLSSRQIFIIIPNVSEFVLQKFQIDEDGKYYNERLEAEMKKALRFSERQSQIAKKRWSKNQDGNAMEDATASEKSSHGNAFYDNDNDSIITSLHNRTPTRMGDAEADELKRIEEKITSTFKAFIDQWKRGEFSSTEELALMAAKIPISRKKGLNKYFAKFKKHLLHERRIHRNTHDMAKNFLSWLRIVAKTERK